MLKQFFSLFSAKNSDEKSLELRWSYLTKYRSRNPLFFWQLPDQYKHDEEFVVTALTFGDWKQVPRAFIDNREFLLNAYLAHPEIARIFMEDDFPFNEDNDFIIAAVKDNRFIFQDLSEEIRDNIAIVSEVVKIDGTLLEFVSYELRDNRAIVLEAMNEMHYALGFASEAIKSDKEFIENAVRRNPLYLSYASSKLLNDRDFMLEMMEKYNKTVWQYAPEPLREELRSSLRQQPEETWSFD